MSRILVPSDGSSSSLRALDFAIAQAKRDPSIELHLLNVQPEPAVYGEIQVYVSNEKMRSLQLDHGRDLLQPAIEKAQASGVRFASEILIGDPVSTICGRADALACDSIVMGTRGMTALSNLIMGSVASKVVHLSKLPVTLVK